MPKQIFLQVQKRYSQVIIKKTKGINAAIAIPGRRGACQAVKDWPCYRYLLFEEKKRMAE